MTSTLTDLPLVTPLTIEQLRQVGIPEEWRFGIADRVRFSELDMLNHVNNAVYFSWFENVRLHYFPTIGFADWKTDALQIVLATNSARYHKPLFLNDHYVTTARVKSYRTSSFVMEFAVFGPKGLACVAETVIVAVGADGATKQALPSELVAAFKAEGATGPA